MVKRILTVFAAVLLACSATVAQAMPDNRFNGIRALKSDTGYRIVFDFTRSPNAKMQVLEDAVQLVVKNAFVTPSKKVFKVKNPEIREVHVYQFDPSTLRIRIFPEGSIREFAGRLALNSAESGLAVTFPISQPSVTIQETQTPPAAEEAPPAEAVIPEESRPEPAAPPAEEKSPAGVALFDRQAEEEPLPSDTRSSTSPDGFLKYEEPSAPEMPGMGSTMVRVVSALLIVLAMVLAVAWLAKKYMGGIEGRLGDRRNVKVLGNHMIGVKKHVTLVEVGGEVLVLGVTGSSINLLTKYDDSEKVENFRLNSRLPRKPMGLAKKIPGFKWGVGGKSKPNQTFAREVAHMKKVEEEKASARPQAKPAPQAGPKAGTEKKQKAREFADDMIARLKRMQEGGAASREMQMEAMKSSIEHTIGQQENTGRA